MSTTLLKKSILLPPFPFQATRIYVTMFSEEKTWSDKAAGSVRVVNIKKSAGLVREEPEIKEEGSVMIFLFHKYIGLTC